MEFYDVLIKAIVVMAALTVCTGFVLVESGKNDDKSVETKIVYLIDLLEKLKDITEDSDYVTDDVTSYTQFDDVRANKKDEISRDNRIQKVDDTYARLIDIRKKDFAILPPANEWCRMMGFRRCRQSHS